MVIDTASEQSFVRPDVVSHKHIPNSSQQLRGITGHHASLKGPVDVRIKVGEVEENFAVYVADIEDPFILGLDYLLPRKCHVNLETMQMKLRGKTIPVRVNMSKKTSVKAMRAVTIPPMSEKIMMCKLEEPMKNCSGLIEPDTQCTLADGVMVGRTLVNPAEGQIPVVIANFSNRPRKVKKGTDVAYCQEVDEPLQLICNRGSTADPQKVPPVSDNVPHHLQDLLDRSSVHLNESQKQQLEDLLVTFADVFSSGDHDIGCTGLVEHEINTGDHAPIKQPPRRIGPVRRKEMEEAVEKLRRQGVIEKSFSPWSSNVVLVRKRDGTTRCCIDYRALNSVTLKDSYPLPRVDDTLDSLAGAQWFGTLDMTSGYHQVKLREQDKSKTAFSFGQGLWQFRYMPFGLCNAPATFERLMERVLDGLHWRTALVFLDDVIVYGSSFEQELQRLSEVFCRFRAAQLKLSPKKCHLFQKEVRFLGHLVSDEGVSTDPAKISAVRDWPVPTCEGELRSFIGLCSYYRRFVKSFATIAAPLHNLLGKNVKFEWSSACQQAFQQLKDALTSSPILQYPDPSKPFILDCDASNSGVGSVLSQKKDDQEFVVAYFSQKFSEPERNYCVTRKELLAIIKSLFHFHPYLYGAKFMIRTDHAALRWLKTLKNPEGQMARWIGKLDQYDYEIQHRPGRVHSNADSLSRRPCEPDCRHCVNKEARMQKCSRTVVRSDLVADNKKMQELQMADRDLKPIIHAMKNSSVRPAWEKISASSPVTKNYWAQWEALRLDDGVLQRKWITKDGVVKYWQTVIPKQLRQDVMKETHDNVAGGHLGVKKTLSHLRQRCYWIHMRRDVQEWCRTCDICCAKKGPKQKGRAPMKLYQVGAPMERVAVDIAGPLTTSASGNRYICVAMDYFTKWPEAYAIPNQEATTVAQVLVDNFFCRFGMPKELHSDQGRNFESAVFQECCHLLGIRKTRTTPLRPQSDGMVEKFNWTLGQELAKYCTEGQTEWDVKLPALLMAYRSAEHQSTGYSPAMAMLGHELRLPLDLLTGRPPDEELPKDSHQFVKELQHKMEEIHHQMRDNLKLSGDAMKQYYDIKASQANFTEGDQVWFYNPQRKKGLSPKLSSSWEGPYAVVQKLSDVTIRIKGGKRGACKVVHANRLWHYHGEGHYTWSDPADQPVDDTAEAQAVDISDGASEPPEEENVDTTVVVPQTDSSADTPELRRSTRQKRQPKMYGDAVRY